MNIYIDNKNETQQIISYVQTLTDKPHHIKDDCFIFKLLEELNELPHGVSIRFYENSNKTEYKNIFGEIKEIQNLSDVQSSLIEDINEIIKMKKDDIKKLEDLSKKII